MTYHSVQPDWKDFQTALEIEELELVENKMLVPLSMGCDMFNREELLQNNQSTFFEKQPESLRLIIICGSGVETVVWSAVQQEQAGTKKRDKGDL